jgi:predicted Zn-dependent protease with MMP-like domain
MSPSDDQPSDLFELALDQAIDDLPGLFRAQLDSVAIVVEDEPTAAQLQSVGAFGLFGLYTGIPRTAYGADQAPVPSKITLFRGPLTRAYRDPVRLAAAVRDTLNHEIAHHLGIGDARLDELRLEHDS